MSTINSCDTAIRADKKDLAFTAIAHDGDPIKRKAAGFFPYLQRDAVSVVFDGVRNLDEGVARGAVGRGDL